MEKLGKFLTKHIWVVILGLSLPAVWSLFVRGFFGVSDDIHIAWLYEMDRLVKMGQFPPRFVPDLSYGFGYPLFNFVFPLPFYLGEAIHLLGVSLVDSIKALFILSIPVSMYFMYRLLKEFTSEWLALAWATIYVYVPYRATDIFVRGAVGEVVAFAFLPLVLLSFVKLKEKSLKWIGIAGLSTAALITSHNIIAYMFFPFLLLYLVMKLVFHLKDRFPIAKKFFAGIILGLLASIYFWLPAVYESRLVKYSTVFDFRDHFPTLKQLITPYFGYGASVAGPGDGMSFFMGTVSLVVIVLGALALLKYRKKLSRTQSVFVVWAAITLTVSIFMMNFRSTFVWEAVPLLPYFQFPWRFLTMVAFSAPIFVVAFSRFKYQNYLGLALTLLAIALNFSYFKPEAFLGRTDEYYLNRYIPTPNASMDYKTTSEEYLRLPLATQERPSMVFPRAYTDARAIVSIKEVNPLDASITTDYPESFILNYNKYYFPGWVARIDGQGVDISAGRPYGQISIEVPGGMHSVDIFYQETAFRRVMDYLSILALVGSLFLIIKPLRHRHEE